MSFFDLIEMNENEFTLFFTKLSWKEKQVMIQSIKRIQFLRRCQFKIQMGITSEYGLTLQEELYLRNAQLSLQEEGHIALNTYGLAAFRVLKYQENDFKYCT
jgi:hypothetical protein